MLPDDRCFPDRYDGSEEAFHLIFRRVAKAMQVDSEEIEVELFGTDDDPVRELLPYYSGTTKDAAGLYYHDPTKFARIEIHHEQLKDPLGLVATIAHELGHVILLRPGLVDGDEPKMEPLNDLLTVFLGFGVFTANSAFQFKQYGDHKRQGWSTSRLGYLSEELFGYALARFALERGEVKPAWANFLATNVAAYFKQSTAWMKEHRELRILSRI